MIYYILDFEIKIHPKNTFHPANGDPGPYEKYIRVYLLDIKYGNSFD